MPSSFREASMHVDVDQRRSFLRQVCAAGLSSALLAAPARPACGQIDGDETKTYPSHGPGRRWLTQSRKLIAEIILPPPKCRQIDKQLAFSFRLENVFYLELGEHAVLIDTGFDHQVDLHLDNLQSLGRKLDKIVAILATHSHVDHTGGLKRAQDRLQVPIVAHHLAAEPVGQGDLLRTAAIIPELAGWRFEFPACGIDEEVDDGDEIIIGDQTIRVVHIPGHTPDCLGYVWQERFFTGDAVFGGGAIGWANERWHSSYADHAESMHLLKDSGLAAKTFYPAHGPGLPYSTDVPKACLTTLDRLASRQADPCNRTARCQRRSPDDPRRRVLLA